jgi:hypothetical protein
MRSDTGKGREARACVAPWWSKALVCMGVISKSFKAKMNDIF